VPAALCTVLERDTDSISYSSAV